MHLIYIRFVFVIKKLRYILTIIVGLLAVLYISIILVVSLPGVKSWLAEKTSESLSETIGSKVSIENITVNLFNSVTAENVKIYDQSNKEMLTVKRMDATIALAPLFKSELVISNIKLFNSKATLYKRTVDEKPNYQFLIDSLSPKKDTEQKFKVVLSSVLVNDLSMTYDVLAEPHKNKLFDVNHINLEKLNTSLIIKSSEKESLFIRIRDLYLKTKNGIEVSKLQAILSTPNKGRSYQYDIKRMLFNIENVNGNISDSRLVMNADSQDKTFLKSLENVSVNGLFNIGENKYVTNLLVSNDRPAYARPLHAKFLLTDGIRSLIDANLESSYSIKDNLKANFEVSVTQEDINTLLSAFNQPLPSSSLFAYFDNLSQKGSFEIYDNKISFIGTTNTNLCNISEDIKVRNHTADYKIDAEKLQLPSALIGNDISICNSNIAGTLTLTNHNIQEIISLGIPQILSESNINLNASFGEIKTDAFALNNIETTVRYSKDVLDAELKLADQKAKFDAKILANSMLNSPEIHINACVDNMNLTMFGLNSSLISSFSAKDFTADIKSIHDFNFRIKDYGISNNEGKKICYDNETNIKCESGNNSFNYFVNSERVDGQLNTNLEFKDILSFIKHNISSSLPSLITNNTFDHNLIKGFANLRLTIDKSIKKELDYLGYNITPLSPIDVYGQINTSDNLAKLTLSASKLEINEESYDNASIYFSGNQDEINGSLMITKYFNDKPVRLESHIKGFDDKLCNELIWKEKNQGKTSGNIITETSFHRNHNNLAVSTKVLPSNVFINDTLWQIAPSVVSFEKDKIKVNDFRIFHDEQFVNINTNKEGKERELLVELNDIEVAYILGMTNLKPVEFSGKAKGFVRNKPNSDNITANLNVTDFCFNKGPMGTLYLDGLYTTEDGHINIDAKTQATPEDSTLIKGFICPADKTLDLHMKSEKTNLQFLNKYLGRFISDLEGNTSGNYHLFGDFKYVNMEGDHRINYMQFRPKILGVLYTFENDSVHLRPDTINLSGMTVRDPYGNKAIIQGSVNHRDLFKFNYNIDFLLDNLQVMNWVESPSRPFWGSIFTSGNMGISGTLSNVNISGELTSSGNPGMSTLFYNSETTASEDEGKRYIQFITPEQKYSKQNDNEENNSVLLKDEETDVHMNFKFDVNPNATLNIITDPLTKDYMSLNGNGPIRMSFYNKGNFELNGQYAITGGNYKLTIKDIIRKNFDIQPGGFLRFNGNPSEGNLSIKGVHKISSVSLSDLNVGASHSNSTVGVDCILNFTGKTSDPKVSFDLDFPNANSDENQILKNIILTEEDRNLQVVYLLSIGRFYTYNYDTFAAGGQSQSSVAMTSFLAGTLSGQINNLLQDAFHINNWNFGTNIAAGRQGFNDMEVQGSLSGKMFNNRLLFNGNFGYRDQITTYSNNFVGDFNLQWLLNRAGTISLKAYSETNDRYFTKSSLTTQGGGILFQKDFNRISEFLHKKDLLNVKKKN